MKDFNGGGGGGWNWSDSIWIVILFFISGKMKGKMKVDIAKIIE